jgi:hypothetical protein
MCCEKNYKIGDGLKTSPRNSKYRGADKWLAQPDWKNILKGRHFSSNAEVIAAA